MAVTDIPLKIRDANGNLQRLSTSEENYLAYQLGLNLAERSTGEVSALTLNSSGAVTVGSHTDTFYTDPVGTAPGSSISAPSTVVTTLYQVDGNADSSGLDWRIPVGFEESDDSFREMVDSDFDSLVTRLVSVQTTNDYPGVYYLDSDGFSDPDWDVHITSVFSDTQTDGTTVNYNIFQRQTITPPTAVRPMAIKRTSGRTGDYDGGLQEFTDAQIKYTLGQRAKTVIMSSGIGTYQLRSSAQGAPTDPGNWVAKGIAVDTRKDVSDVNYVGSYGSDYVGTFAGTSTQQYAGQFTTGYTGAYARQYTGQYTGDFAGSYGSLVDKSYVGNYIGAASYVGLRSFAGSGTAQYAGTASQQFTGFYIRQYVRQFTGFYIRQYVGQYSGTYKRETNFAGFYFNNAQGEEFTGYYTGTQGFTGTFSGFYGGNVSKQFSGFYGGNVAKQYTGTVAAQYTGTTTVFYTGSRSFAGTASFAGTYTGQYTRQYVGSFTSNFSGQFTNQYAGVYSRQYTGVYAQQYAGVYTGQYTGVSYAQQYAGQTIQSSSSTIETYTLYVRTA